MCRYSQFFSILCPFLHITFVAFSEIFLLFFDFLPLFSYQNFAISPPNLWVLSQQYLILSHFVRASVLIGRARLFRSRRCIVTTPTGSATTVAVNRPRTRGSAASSTSTATSVPVRMSLKKKKKTLSWNQKWDPLTILRRVCIGRRRVSLILLAGAFFGLDDGVCTAQHLIKIPMTIMKAKPISRTAHQHSVTHWARVWSVSLLNNRFLSRANGPSASTARHL